jgi:hypothetical protein
VPSLFRRGVELIRQAIETVFAVSEGSGTELGRLTYLLADPTMKRPAEIDIERTAVEREVES